MCACVDVACVCLCHVACVLVFMLRMCTCVHVAYVCVHVAYMCMCSCCIHVLVFMLHTCACVHVAYMCLCSCRIHVLVFM